MIRLTCVALVTAVVAAAPARAESATATQFNAAYLVAQKLVPGGTLIKARVEGVSPNDVFGFYFFLQGYIVEVEVNGTGKVVKKKKSDKDPVSPDVLKLLAKSKGPAKVPAGRLLEIAGDAVKGTPLSDLKYDVQGDRLVVVVNGVTIDAATGDVISGR